jgi:quaternary ammonium compound-resistance protein SugE
LRRDGPAWRCSSGAHLRQDGLAIPIFRLFKEFDMAWVYLLVAGVLEVVWAFTMKQSHGFTNIKYSAITLVAMIASFGLLSVAMRSLPLGTAYTIWTGIGAVGAFIVGITVLGEALTPMRVVAALLIVSGLVLMKLSSS